VVCRIEARRQAEINFQEAAKRPPGRAPRLSVCLPPWHLIGHPSTCLTQAYGGFWGIKDPSTEHYASQHYKDKAPEEPQSEMTTPTFAPHLVMNTAVKVLAQPQGRSGAKGRSAPAVTGEQCATMPECRACCKLSLQMLTLRWQSLFTVATAHMRKHVRWLRVVVRIVGKGSCDVGAAVCVAGGSGHGELRVVGFVTSATAHASGSAHPAGIASVDAAQWGGLQTAVVLNPYAVCHHRRASVAAL
jgi:hypothetical protein